MSAMTLERVRDMLDMALDQQAGSRVTIHVTRAKEARDFIDTHLTAHAQMVEKVRDSLQSMFYAAAILEQSESIIDRREGSALRKHAEELRKAIRDAK